MQSDQNLIMQVLSFLALFEERSQLSENEFHTCFMTLK